MAHSWQLLSDLGRYEDAEDSYQSALACPDVYEPQVQFNRAIVAARTGDFTHSIEILYEVGETGDEEFDERINSQYFYCTRRLRDHSLSSGCYYDAVIDVPCDDVDEDGTALRFMQEVTVAAESEYLALDYLREDLGTKYAEAILDSIEVESDATSDYAGVTNLHLPRQYYRPDASD